MRVHVSTKTRSAVKRHCDELLTKQNVIGVGAGLEEKDGTKTGREAVIVLVRNKLPISRLSTEDLVPRELDDDGELVPTDVIEVGDIYALPVDHKDEHRPLVPGISCGHHKITAGTLGLIVKKNNIPYILSNNHVIADTNKAEIGDPIWQPAPADGGRSDDVVAELSEFIDISFVGENLVDCAIARITLDMDEADNQPPEVPPLPPTPPRPPKKEKKKDFIERIFEWVENFFKRLFGKKKRTEQVAQQRYVDPLAVDGVDFTNKVFNLPITITKKLDVAEVGDKVQKSGRTTGFTEGEVLAVDAVVNVNYGSDGVARFEDQILCTYMSRGGDSGSAVFNENGDLVGLLFAGSATVTILNKIEHVFDALGIEEIA